MDIIFQKGLYLSGGSIYTCLSHRNINDITLSEDLDFYVCGKQSLIDSVQYLSNGMKDIIYSVKNNVITLIGRGMNIRNIQIIYTDKHFPAEIFDHFDLDYLKYYYDGNNVYMSNMARMTLNYNTIEIKSLRQNYKKKSLRIFL